MVPATKQQLQRVVVGQVQAEDKDWGENGRLHYSLVDVNSGGGSGARNKFTVDSRSGVIDAVGPLNAGEKYILSIQVI
jgi:hypothetical protein